MNPPTLAQLRVLALLPGRTEREVAELLRCCHKNVFLHARALRRKKLLEPAKPSAKRAYAISQLGHRALVHHCFRPEKRCSCGAAFFGESCPFCVKGNDHAAK